MFPNSNNISKLFSKIFDFNTDFLKFTLQNHRFFAPFQPYFVKNLAYWNLILIPEFFDFQNNFYQKYGSRL